MCQFRGFGGLASPGVADASVLVVVDPRAWPAAAGLPADVLTACVSDTLAAVTASGRTAALLGTAPGRDPGDGHGPRVDLEGDGPDEHLAAAMTRLGGPVAVVGPTTPQLSAALVDDLVATVEDPWHEAVVGLTAADGFWALGLSSPDPMALLGLPLAGEAAGRHLLDRLHGLGLRVGLLPRLVEADDADAARTVSEEMPGSALASLLDRR